MEYISLSWYDILDKDCGSYQDFIDRELLLIRKLLNQWFLVIQLKSSLRKFYSRHHDLVNRYGVSVSQNVHGSVPFVVITIRSCPHSWLITGFVTRGTKRVQMCSMNCYPREFTLVFSRMCVARSVVFCIVFCRLLFSTADVDAS